MKRKSKIVTYAMTGALSLGIIGGTIIPTYAATVQKETVNVEEYKKLDAETQLKELGVSLPDHNYMRKGDKFSNLDDETKTKVQAIMNQLKDGSLTQEEADTQLKELGVSLPDHKFMRKGDKFSNLDEETKKEVTKLIEKAKVQMEELGVDLPTKFNQLID